MRFRLDLTPDDAGMTVKGALAPWLERECERQHCWITPWSVELESVVDVSRAQDFVDGAYDVLGRRAPRVVESPRARARAARSKDGRREGGAR